MDKKKRNILVIEQEVPERFTIISSPDSSTYQKLLISILTEMIIWIPFIAK